MHCMSNECKYVEMCRLQECENQVGLAGDDDEDVTNELQDELEQDYDFMNKNLCCSNNVILTVL